MAMDVDLKSLLETEDEMPKLTRGRSSDDYDVIIDAIKTGKVHSIPNVDDDQRAKLGQKIRGAAAKAGLPVTVRYSKSNEKLYFQLNASKLNAAQQKELEVVTETPVAATPAKAQGSAKKAS